MTTVLPTRTLGQQGLTVSALGLGCMGMSGIGGLPNMYGAVDHDEVKLTLRHALARGVTLFDTAEAYGPFENEKLLGEILSDEPGALISSKFGFTFGEQGRISGVDSRPAHIRTVVEASLQRLKRDHLEVLFQHRVDPAVPIEEVAETVGGLVKAGKVRYFGLSEASSSTIRRAHAVHPVSVLQSEYSLWERGLEAKVLPTLRELGIGLMAYCPLGRGFLSGQAQRAEDLPEGDYRRNDPRYQGAHFDTNLRLVSLVREIGQSIGASPAAVALAWLLAQDAHLLPIPGTKRRRYLDDNLSALDVQLSAAQLATLDAASRPGHTAGPRYGEAAQRLLDRDPH